MELREYLAERDVACPGCGYNLRGLPDAHCPECHQELQLTVGLLEPRVGALIACLAFLFAGTGAAAAVLITVAAVVVLYRDWPRGVEAALFMWLPLGCVLTCGIPAMTLVRRHGRVWFRKLTARKRGQVVAAAIAVPVLWFVAFLVTLTLRF